MPVITMSSGHGNLIRGASGVLDEVDEARKVVDRVGDLLRSRGTKIHTFHDNTSTTQSQNLNTIVAWHNSLSCDIAVSCHFNAYEATTKPMGTEVLFITQEALAERMSAAIAEAGHFKDRGEKYRSDLAFLNGTEAPAILIETCFVDSQADADLYHEHFDDICQAIAGILDEAKVA
jgi:N-acetylmuramoyl-L-alanine amidase